MTTDEKVDVIFRVVHEILWVGRIIVALGFIEIALKIGIYFRIANMIVQNIAMLKGVSANSALVEKSVEDAAMAARKAAEVADKVVPMIAPEPEWLPGDPGRRTGPQIVAPGE